MKNNPQPVDILHEALGPALQIAFLRAAELAKQTRTYLVIQNGDKIRRISYEDIDEFINENRK
ncbi:MAG: hypothetical protein QM752_07300 [Gammaproteobacteria bacterium]